jgi:hypothetical protein
MAEIIFLPEVTEIREVTAGMHHGKTACLVLTRTDGEVLHPLEAQGIDLMVVRYGCHQTVVRDGTTSLRGYNFSVKAHTLHGVNGGTVVDIVVADKGDE